MPTLSPDIAERARKNETTVLQAFSRLSQTRVADRAGKSDTLVSNLKDKDLANFCAVLAACDLKVVPIDMQCFPRDKVNALLTLARDHLAQIEQPEQLTWE